MLKILSLGFEKNIPEECQCVASGIQTKALASGTWPRQWPRGLHKATAYITKTADLGQDPFSPWASAAASMK